MAPPPHPSPVLALTAIAACLLVSPLAVTAASPPEAGWTLIPVPGAWEQVGPPAARDYDGFAWYRAWFRPSDSTFTPHERNLFEESANIAIRGLADAHEIFVNGRRIGAGGAMPPAFKTGRDGNHRHKIPPGTLRKGQWNLVAIRVYNASGPGGFTTEAPFTMDYFQECVFEGPWEFRLGDDPAWAAGNPLPQRPAQAAFERFHESNRVLGEASEPVHGPKLPPSESLARMSPGENLAVDLLLSEPLVAQPTHLSWDERGRLWVSQYRQYPYPAGARMLSRDHYYRAHYDTVPAPPPNHVRGRDRISIHEDTDGDGVYDRHSVFQDGLNLANAAVRGHGGVWIMNPPYLLFYPDADFDDIPDGPPQVRLQGFGLEDTHSVANGLVWGPDGWLYGAQGSTTSSHVTRPDIDPPTDPGVYFQGCMVWRYHPESRAYEIFAEGSGNTFGLEFDAEGRLFSGHNGGDTRGWHYVQGAFFLVQGVDPGKFGPPRHPYTFGELPMMPSDHRIQRFTHFGAVVEGSAMPPAHRGRLFSLDPLHNVVISSERRVRGSSFITRDLPPALTCADTAFRPVFIANAPDGTLHIADFYEHFIAHGQHYQSQIDPTSGRIFRLRGAAQPLERAVNLAALRPPQWIDLLGHPNKWHRQTAVRLLGERRDPDTLPPLRALLESATGHAALGALWALHQMDAWNDALALRALQHPDAPVRLWTVRLLGDRYGLHPGLGSRSPDRSPAARELPASLLAALTARAQVEPDAEVRSQIAASARRWPVEQTVPLINALLRHDEDLDDPYLPLMTWWALEAKVAQAPDRVVALFASPDLWKHPIAAQHTAPRLMKRFALEGRRQDFLHAARLLRLAPSQVHAQPLVAAFQEAARGRALVGLPTEWLDALAAAGESPLVIRLRLGQPRAVEEALASLQASGTRTEDRLALARALGELRPPETLPTLLHLARSEPEPSTRNAVLASLGAWEDPAIARELISILPTLSAESRIAALTTLAGRTTWTRLLLDAVARGSVAPNLLPWNIADPLRTSRDPEIRELARAALPVPVATADRDGIPGANRIEDLLRERPGNPYAGEPLYLERCGVCHTLFFKGGRTGPDLTPYQRDNLSTLLSSILQPSLEIREGFQFYQAETRDGRSLSGFIVDQDAQVTVMRLLDGQDVVLPKSEVLTLEPSARSLMPEGLLDGLSDDQIRDLFAYLRISQPISR